MILVYLAVVGSLLLALAVVLAPLRKAPRPFPENPRPQELRIELEALKREVKELSGPERVRLLKRIAWIERELGIVRQREAARADRARVRFPAWGALLLAAGGIALAAVLVQYTLPRLPGGTVTEAFALEEARTLRELQARAERENTPEAWLAYADYAFELRDLERAAQGYARAIELDPRNPRAYRRYGMILFFAGRAEEAAEILSVVTRVDPDPEGLLFLGNAYFQLGEYERAIAAWRDYLSRGGEARERVERLIEAARARLAARSPGEAIFAQKCAACHGARGEGGTGPRLAKNPILNVPEAVVEIVRNGRGAMPAIPMTDEEMAALLAFLREL